MFANDFTIGL